MFPHKNPLIIAIVIGLAISAGVFLGLWSRSHRTSLQVNSTNSYESIVSSTPVNLTDICNCDLIISDGVSVALFDPVTQAKTATLTSGGNGEGNSSQPGYITTSPSGRQVLLDDRLNKKVLLVDSTTGKTIRTLAVTADQFVNTWAWSPDESTLLLGTNHQPTSAASTDTAFEVLKWNKDGGIKIPIPTNYPLNEVSNLFSISNNGSQVLLGWSTGQTVELYSLQSDKSLKKIALPSISLNLQNSHVTLSAISDGRALLATGQNIYRIDLATSSGLSVMSDAMSLFQISPTSPDGNSILIVRRKPGTAHSQVTRFIPSLNTNDQIVPTFDVGDGFQQSVWLPGGRFLAVHNSYGDKWYVIDVSLGQTPFRPLTLPKTDVNEQIIGFWQTSPMTIEKVSLYDLGGHELSASEKNTLEAKITDWSLYQPDTNIHFLPGECGHPDADQQTARLDASDKKSYLLNGVFQLIETPNLFHWDAAGLKSYADKSICGVGGPFPNAIVEDKILWWQQCLGGKGPDHGEVTRKAIVFCTGEES